MSAVKTRRTDQCVYITKSPHLPFVKMGCWSNSLGALQSRYRMYHGHDISMYTFSVQNMKIGESALKARFLDYRVSGELYSVTQDMPLSSYVREAANILTFL